MKNASRRWWLRSSLLLLLLLSSGFYWSQQSGLVAADSWSWEEQLQMEVAMRKTAESAPGSVPEIDRFIPTTETALFALG